MNMIFGNSQSAYSIVPRDKWEDRFGDFFERFALNYQGHPEVGRYKSGITINDRGEITTSKFEINPYYWGDDEEEYEKPNFLYYKGDFELRWYKYPLRAAYANKDLTYEQFDEILTDCENLE